MKLRLSVSLLGLFSAASSVSAFVAPFSQNAVVGTRSQIPSSTSAVEENGNDLYIDEERRSLMNLIVLGSTAVTVGALGIPYLAFFFPPSSGDGATGAPAKDALGNDIVAAAYLNSKPAGDRSLVQGLKGDAT
jgi:cytochrome b6-f complex iron-sulfur subunit